MKIVSWNCRGLGHKDKKEAMGKLIRSKKPQILLIQKTKMKGKDVLLEMQKIWKTSIGAAISARGASGGICTLWNPKIFHLDSKYEVAHWLMTKLVHLPSGKAFPIINVYMPNNYWEKVECWESLMSIRDIRFQQNCIIVADFNTTMHLNEKREGSVVKDPSKKKMEDLVSTLDLFDVQPSKGKFTCSNKRAGMVHIATRLDRFLIHSPLLSLPDEISSLIIPLGSSDYRPISLSFTKEENLGPIPFRFNPLWMEKSDLFPLVSRSWCQWVVGSPIHIWEQKLKRVEVAIKDWVKNYVIASHDGV